VFEANDRYAPPGYGESMREGLAPACVYETLVMPTTVSGAATRASSA
jgi:hypothetical protein